MISRGRGAPSLRGLAVRLCPGTIPRRSPPSERGGHRYQPPSQYSSLPYPGFVVGLGAVAALIVRGEIEGVDDSLLVSAEAALHYEGVFLSSDQVEVGSEVTIDIPGLPELSQS